MTKITIYNLIVYLQLTFQSRLLYIMNHESPLCHQHYNTDKRTSPYALRLSMGPQTGGSFCRNSDANLPHTGYGPGLVEPKMTLRIITVT